MATRFGRIIGLVALVCLANLPGTARAQQAQRMQQSEVRVSARAAAYDAKREVVVQGTVLSFPEDSTSRPTGAHALVQTPTGNVDVHLGPSSYLRANHFSLAAGESVRFVGAMSATDSGTILLARTGQKGSQVVTIRSPQGFLIGKGGPRTLTSEQRAQGEQKVSAR